MTHTMTKNSQHLRASIATYTGVEFFPLAPRFEDIYVEDLAHHLANVNRYNGACTAPYSVAQHSVHVAEWLAEHVGLAPLGAAEFGMEERNTAESNIVKWGLLHDASEAYVSDICGPIKPFIMGYKEIEDQLLVAVAQRFALPWPEDSFVKYADKAVFASERRQVMPMVDWWNLHEDHPDAGMTIIPWPWYEAKERFLQKFEELFGSDVLQAYRRP
jgi:hypothetical protein